MRVVNKSENKVSKACDTTLACSSVKMKIEDPHLFHTIFLLSAHIYNMEGKASTQKSKFSYVYLPIVQAECWVSEFENF